MSMPLDQVVDRRRMRRKLTFWRIGSLLLLAALIIAILGASDAFRQFARKASPHVAKVSISGVITEDRKLLKLLADIGKDDAVKGVILTIDSPGGSTVGGEAMYEAVRELAGKKPVVASVGTLAASAGYMIAAASDHIVARRSSIVGSIGVLFQFADASVLLDKVGVKMEEVKSSPLKAEPSPFHPASPETRAMLKRLIDDSYDWFVDLVTERRPLNREEVLKLADGTVFSGGQGLDNKLVDAIGGEAVARKWLTDQKGVGEKLKTIEWKVPGTDANFPLSGRLAATVLKLLGYDPSIAVLGELDRIVPKRIFLDGLVSIWQASPQHVINKGDVR